MSELVIDIRDRIEKMRTQMTGSSTAVAQDKKKQEIIREQTQKTKKIEKVESLSPNKNLKKDIASLEISNQPIKEIENKKVKVDIDEKVQRLNEQSESKKFQQKTYKDYQNENIFDDNKKTVKLDENKPFPQFNLNVSNPISWKLMLLIMLMQLLTNIMLVVVLYLK